MKYTINELANSKGVSPLVREALLQMEADLVKANAQAEHFEREWYLRGDELEATNRQVEILSDALAESRREVAALKAVQEPVAHGVNPLWLATHPDKLTTPPAAQPAPVQEPVAWVTVEDGKCISTRSADFRRIADGQYQLYVGPLAYEVPAAIKTLEALGCIYEEGEQWTAPPAAQRQWVGLTEDEIDEIFNNWPTYHLDHCEFAQVVQAKVFEKNGAIAVVIPDALNPKEENLAYAAGWNDCRAEMLKGMKP
jgi:hypothetical protein